MEQSEKTLDMIVNLCKNRGYVFPGSEIYGGRPTAGTTAPGRGIQEQRQEGMAEEVRAGEPLQCGLDAAIIMNPRPG